MAKAKFFHATKPKTSSIGDGTVGDLVDWLEKYVNVLFPENGIEYWADNQYGDTNDLKRFQAVPGVFGCKGTDIHHVACYVQQGGCEGLKINVSLVLRDGTLKSLTWVKTFGNEDETWLIVRAINSALDSIFFYEEMPEIVGMADKIPRQQKWHRETSLTEVVSMASNGSSLTVTTRSGLVLDNRDWSDKGINAKFYVDARVSDWKTVFANMKVLYTETNERKLVVEDLPGYVISDRGVEGCTGFYVLPPGGNSKMDPDYVGYFPTDIEAITAARFHRDNPSGIPVWSSTPEAERILSMSKNTTH